MTFMAASSSSSLQKACYLVAFVVIVASFSLLSSRHGIWNDTDGLLSLQDTEVSNRTGSMVGALDHGVHAVDTELSNHTGTAVGALDNGVHVVLASTDEMIPGVEASIRSIKSHASRPITFHYIGDSPLRPMPDVKYYSLSEASQKYQLEDFVCLGDRRDGQNNINTMHANYARFVLDELLPRTVKKAMYLDVDTAVLCDVNSLIDGVLNDNGEGGSDTGANTSDMDSPVIAAVPRDHIYGLTRKGEKKYGSISPSFNAGAYIVHLERWRDQKMGDYIRYIALMNNKRHWYYLGSQPPLNIAIGSHFEWLPIGWNVKAKRVKSGFKTRSGEEVCLVHWTGPVKPWQTNDSNAVDLLDTWQKYDKPSRTDGEVGENKRASKEKKREKAQHRGKAEA